MVDRMLALEPANTDALGLKAHVFWATGDLQAVEPLLANPGTEPLCPGGRSPVRGVQALFQRRYAAAIEMFSNAVSAETKRGEPSEGDKFLLALSQQRAGDVAAARATYEKAAQDIQRELEKVAPGSKTEAFLHGSLGLAYAGLGEAASAIAEGQKAMAMDPSSKDSMDGPAQEELMAQIYALLGDADHAIPILKRLLQMPYAWAITPACCDSIQCGIRSGTIRASRNSSPRPRRSNIWGAVAAARSTSLPPLLHFGVASRARLHFLRSVKSAPSAVPL